MSELLTQVRWNHFSVSTSADVETQVARRETSGLVKRRPTRLEEARRGLIVTLADSQKGYRLAVRTKAQTAAQAERVKRELERFLGKQT